MEEFDQKEYQTVILAALLHDVGKIVVRAGKASDNHEKCGGEWFRKILAEKLPNFDEKELLRIQSMIENHHAEDSVIQLANAISSGTEHLSIEDDEKAEPFRNSLVSIFSGISTSSVMQAKYHRLVPFGKEELTETFPTNVSMLTTTEYARHLYEFETEIRALNFESLSQLQIIDKLSFLLWKYCWCIPLDHAHVGLSLYDHLKTTAALAGCLFFYQRENLDIKLNLESNAFYLVGGDISGIQGYIFDALLQQGRVAKRLRARSLFIQLMSEIASHQLLKLCDLSLCNILMSAGGNFYIILPNIKGISEDIEGLQKSFDEWTLTRLNAELSISVEGMVVSGMELLDFPREVDALKKKLNTRKQQPHKSSLVSNGKWLQQEFLRPEIIECEDKICQSCRQHPRLENSEDGLCEFCADDIRIGQLLPSCGYIAFFNDGAHDFKVLDYSVELWDEEALKAGASSRPYLILELNNTVLQSPIMGFKFITTHIPTKRDIPSADVEKESQPVAFDDIATCATGDNLLGYVKSDVDNLGRIIREGFKGGLSSISEILTFSRMLETFFAGLLDRKLKNDFRDMYAVFSGGDDFFVAGPWNRAIDFAREMRMEFERFCGNRNLTFSSGILIAKPHQPISYCANAVEDELKKAKSDHIKDKVTLFGQILSWEDATMVRGEVDKIIKWMAADPPIISRGLAYNLRDYGEMAIKSGIILDSANIITHYLRFVPLLTCDINRNLSAHEQRDAYAWADDLRITSHKPKGGVKLPYLRTILEYALTLRRGE